MRSFLYADIFLAMATKERNDRWSAEVEIATATTWSEAEYREKRTYALRSANRRFDEWAATPQAKMLKEMWRTGSAWCVEKTEFFWSPLWRKDSTMTIFESLARYNSSSCSVWLEMPSMTKKDEHVLARWTKMLRWYSGITHPGRLRNGSIRMVMGVPTIKY